MYHDMMIKERSVDINTLMKGVFGFSDRSIKRYLLCSFISLELLVFHHCLCYIYWFHLGLKVKEEVEETQKGMMAFKLLTMWPVEDTEKSSNPKHWTRAHKRFSQSKGVFLLPEHILLTRFSYTHEDMERTCHQKFVRLKKMMSCLHGSITSMWYLPSNF